jgi:hypothetical protein
MKSCFFFIAVLFSTVIFGQAPIKIIRDTLPDLNKGQWIQMAYSNNRQVTVEGHIEYAKVHGQNQTYSEYFRMNDSIYYRYEYFANGSHKSKGNFLVTQKLIGPDSSQCEDPSNPGTFYWGITYYQQILKTGDWLEFDSPDPFGSAWQGNYVNGKRTGMWSRRIYTSGKILQVYFIDYDTDSTKILKGDNILINLPADSIAKRLSGRWSKTFISCEDEKRPRILYYQCRKFNGHYGDDCNGRTSVEYIEFLPGNKFIHQFSASCNKMYEGNWKIYSEKGETIVELNFKNQPVSKFRIIYLDNQGYLITEQII